MDTKKLTLIIDGEKKETFEIDAFEVSYGLYEETDIAIIITTKQENVVAEGVLRPSGQGIYKDKLEDTDLINTLYMNQYEQLRNSFRSKIISDDVDDSKFVYIKKISLFTKPYDEREMLGAIDELVKDEEMCTTEGFIKTSKGPKIEFIKEGHLKITEDIDIYKERPKIEDAKIKEE